MSAALDGLPPAPESRATCSDCVLCKADIPADERFRPASKCCTYVPRIPNFLVGRILMDDDPAMAHGRAVLLDRLKRGIGVHPLGMIVDDREHVAYEVLVEAGQFGQAKDLVCPWFVAEGGLCSIWRHRNAVCSTWYCRHDQGARGRRFWQAVEAFLRHLEHTVQLAVARRVRFGNPRDPEAADQALLDGKFGDWITDIEGFYRKCAERLSMLDFDAILRLDPKKTLELLEAMHDAQFMRYTPPSDELRYTFTGTHRELDGQHRLSGYLRFAAITVPDSAVDLITAWQAGTLSDLLAGLSALPEVDHPQQLLTRLVDDEIVAVPTPPPGDAS